MNQRNSLYRTLDIINRLNSGQKLSLELLSQEYQVSSRTIRRDFEIIQEIFGNFVIKEGNVYKAIDNILLDRVLSASNLSVLANIVNLFSITNQESTISKETKALIKKSQTIYDFKTRPYEEIDNLKLLNTIEHAIEFNKVLEVAYKTDNIAFISKFQPYKIIFINENFYLIGVSLNNARVEYRRISLIEWAKLTGENFKADIEIKNFIQKIQTPWSDYQKREIDVIIRANIKIRRYFLKKKYLPSQKVIKEYENGDIDIKYTVTNYKEIEDLLIKWLPNIKIISPLKTKKLLRQSLNRKLSGLSS